MSDPTGVGASGGAGGHPTLRFSASSLVRAIFVVAAVAVVVTIGVRAAGPVMWFVEASVVAALALPLVHRLGRHMPSWVAVLGLTFAAIVLVGGLGAASFTEMEHEADRFRSSVPSAVRQIQEDRPFGGLMEDLKVADQVDRLSDQLADRFSLGQDLPGIASALGGKVSVGFIIWVLAVMLVFTGPAMVQGTVELLPDVQARRVGPALRRAYGDVVRYLGLTTVRALVLGIGTYLVADLLDIDMPVLLGFMMAVCAYIPYVGIFLGALPLALLSVLNGPDESLTILLAALVLQSIDSIVVQPRIHRRSFTFGLFPTLVVTIIGFGLYGVTGLFLGLFAGALLIALLEELGPDLGNLMAGSGAGRSIDVQPADERGDLSSREATPSITDAGRSPEATESSTDSSSSGTDAV